MSPVLSYRDEQLEEPPRSLQDHLIGNYLFIIAQLKDSTAQPPLTLIAYDALRSRVLNDAVYCLVWKLNPHLCKSWEHARRPMIREDEDCYVVLDRVLPPRSFMLPFTRNEGLVFLKEIGEGGQGIVHLCHDIQRSSAGRPQFSAVKVLPPAEDVAHRRRQEREVRHHRKLSTHPNIVTLHRAYRSNMYRFLVMDYHPGTDLDAFITNDPNFYLNSAERVRNSILQLIDALEFSHNNGIYHCDIKPANVFVSRDGAQVYLGDFGFATRERVPGPYGFCGTLAYISPEVFYDTNASNELKDRWGLGVTALYIALIGIEPWGQALPKSSTHSDGDMQYDEYFEYPDVLRERFPISQEFSDMLRGVLHHDPRMRMSMTEMRIAVEKMSSFLTPPEELDELTGEAREIAINIGLIQDPDDCDTGSVLSDTTTLCGSMASEEFIPIQSVDRVSISPFVKGRLDDMAMGLTSLPKASSLLSASGSPLHSPTSEDSESDVGPDTPETLPTTVDEASIANAEAVTAASNSDVPDIEQDMARLTPFDEAGSSSADMDVVHDSTIGKHGADSLVPDIQASSSVVPAS